MATTGVMAVASLPLAFTVHQKRHSAIVSAAHASHASSLVSVSLDLAVRNGYRHLQQRCRCAATSEDSESSTSGGGSVSELEGSSLPETEGRVGESVTGARRRGDAPRTADSTDWISSSLTRRFGLGAGLAWVGVLAFGVISEQVKTRNEVFREEQGTRYIQPTLQSILLQLICFLSC